MDPNYRIDKKRALKVDRKLSPLNPLAAVVVKEIDSPDSPTGTQNSDDSVYKKRTIGMNLRKLATEKGLSDGTFVPKFKSKQCLIRYSFQAFT